MSNKQGYILLHRKLLDSPCWNTGQKYDIRSAWIWLLLEANHADKEILYGGQFITVHRGQKLTSILQLSAEWGVDRKTVKKWLEIWKKAEMIYCETSKKSTLLTVRNYALYQGFKGAKGKGVDNKMDNRVDNRVDNVMDNRVDNKVPQTKNDNNDLNNDKECKRKESPSRKPEPPAGGGEWE